MANFNVNGLTNYVETRKDVLIKNIVLGMEEGDTVPMLRKQLGIKTKERLNYLDVTPELQDGSNCGWNASGSTVFSEREIETAQIKAQDQYCDKLLLGKFAEYQVKIAADKNAADMPFEKEILDEVVRGINKQMEKLVWKGDKTANGDLIDGFITMAASGGSDSAATIAVSIASGTSVYNAIKSVIFAIPERILDKANVFVSPAIFRAFVDALVEKNLYHFAPDATQEMKDITFPGTDIKVHKTFGLKNDKTHIYASTLENMVYGADLMGDEEKIRFWYDDNTELFKYNIHFNAGVKTLYPDMVVLGTAAQDLV